MGTQKFNSDIDVNGEVKGTSLDVNGAADISGATTTAAITSTGNIKAQNGANIYVYDDDDNTRIHINASSNATEGVLRVSNGANYGLIVRGIANSPRLGAYQNGVLDIYGFGNSDGADHAGDDQLARFDFANERFDVNGEIKGDGLDIDGAADISGSLTLGTALATDQQKHLAYFEFRGYGTSDGTNYEMGESMSDTNAPLEHNTSTGSNGLTAQTIQTIMRSGGTVMPRDGVLKKFIGWVTSAGSGTVDIGLFKVTPTDDTSGNLTPTLLVNEQTTASGNAIPNSFSEDSSWDEQVFRAGDIIYSAVKGGTASKAWYFSSTLEIEWS